MDSETIIKTISKHFSNLDYLNQLQGGIHMGIKKNLHVSIYPNSEDIHVSIIGYGNQVITAKNYKKFTKASVNFIKKWM